VGSPHSQLDCPVACPEDGIRGQGKAVGHRDAADGFAILVRLLSEATCQNAAFRRLGPSITRPARDDDVLPAFRQ
jgi:hypothetical protein